MNENKNNTEVLFLKNITHIYNQDHQKIKVLDNINVKIFSGEMVALIGPSGTGKSTLLNIAGLLESPTFGSVSLAGQNCKNLSEDLKTALRGSEI